MSRLIRSVLTYRPALYGLDGGHGMVACLEDADAVDAAGFKVFLDAIGAFQSTTFPHQQEASISGRRRTTSSSLA